MRYYRKISKSLAEAEHDGWMAHKKQNGWVYGENRDDKNRIHSSLIPYGKLSKQDKEKIGMRFGITER